ncbi:hypothetical protein [Saccharothrix sp. Mg75]|uniref:hypothetical protein n=1 Tax=Saccharothrix sp. Mg75 TaxID=3445357 RepID=UPI003EEBEA03
MPNRPPKRRVNLPLLALSLLCLALPFTAVSCESSVGDIEVEYSGWDLAFGGEPSIEVSGKTDDSLAEKSNNLPAQPLVIIALVVLFAGLVLLSTSKALATVGIVVGATASLFLISAQVSVQGLLVREISESEEIGSAAAGDLVETRSGFWLALVLLTALTAYNIATLVRARGGSTAPGAPPFQ